MSLHAILEAIRASGDSQVHEIESNAYTQCSEILATARVEAEQVRSQAYARAVEPAYRERARMTQQARLETLQIIGNARKAFVNTAFDRISAQLATIRTSSHYPQILRQLIEEALNELKGAETAAGRIQLEADPRDRAVLENIMDHMGLELSVQYTLQSLGGLIATSEDGQVVAINTLEARLERATSYLRRYLAALFENEEIEIKLCPLMTTGTPAYEP